MGRRQRNVPNRPLIPADRFGVSFSIKQCRDFGIDPKLCFDWLVGEAGFRRFRLMSYWNEHEKTRGKYDFAALDWQLAKARESGSVITLCLGARQPRWPENHWPGWAWSLPEKERTTALLAFIQAVVERYKGDKTVISYQLENEALLESFGEHPEVNRRRLREEFKLVKRLDPSRPVIMTTSTSWGIPLRRPVPDIVGFSYYRILHSRGKYRHALHFPSLDRLRARAIRAAHRRPSFIHELQLEPWGPTAIYKMTVTEQDKSMGPEHIAANLMLAKKTGLYPIDLWGGEWWYWRAKKLRDPSVWQAVKQELLRE